MKRRKLILTALIATIAAASVVKIRGVEDSPASGELFWEANQAYLFIGMNRLGYSLPAIMHLLPPLQLAPFGLGAQDQKLSTVVFHITPDRADRYVAHGIAAGPLGVLDGHIASGVWRWDGDHFERRLFDGKRSDFRGHLFSLQLESAPFQVLNAIADSGAPACRTKPDVRGTVYADTIGHGHRDDPSPVTREVLMPDTILLVEDEPVIRQLMAGALKSCGYRVLEARHGREALELFPAIDAEIDLVVTDVRMPYVRGTDMIAAFRERRPGLRVLFISGYSDASIQHERHLYKPFVRAEFLAAVEDLLGQGEGG